jgi:tryptophan-rich sensory protein
MDAFEWSTLFLYLVAWWLPTIIGLYTSTMSMFSEETGKRSMRRRYAEFKTTLPKLVPSWAFGPIWAIIYTLIAISSWIYLNYSDTEMSDHHGAYFDAVNGLLLANYVLNMSWTSIFFGFSLYWLGTLVGLLIFLSALAIEVLMWIHSGLSAITVVGALLFIPYVAYSGYAFILALDISINNSISSRNRRKDVQRKDEENGEGTDLTEADLEDNPPEEARYAPHPLRSGASSRRGQGRGRRLRRPAGPVPPRYKERERVAYFRQNQKGVSEDEEDFF